MGIAADIYHTIGNNENRFDAEFNRRITMPRNTEYWVLYHATWINYQANVRRYASDDQHAVHTETHHPKPKDKPLSFGEYLFDLLTLNGKVSTMDDTLRHDCF